MNQKRLEIIYENLFTFGPDIPSPCFIFNLISCLPANLANIMGFNSFELLVVFASGGVCSILRVGDICAEVNRLSEFYWSKKKREVKF